MRHSENPGNISPYKIIAVDDEGGIIDYLVVNDKLEETYEKIRSIYLAESLKLQRLNNKELEKLCTLEIL